MHRSCIEVDSASSVCVLFDSISKDEQCIFFIFQNNIRHRSVVISPGNTIQGYRYSVHGVESGEVLM